MDKKSEDIIKLFEESKKQTLDCIKSDWTLGLTKGNKYIIELSDGEYITFKNDKDEDLSIKLKTASNHFTTLKNSRKMKLDKFLKNNQ